MKYTLIALMTLCLVSCETCETIPEVSNKFISEPHTPACYNCGFGGAYDDQLHPVAVDSDIANMHGCYYFHHNCFESWRAKLWQ